MTPTPAQPDPRDRLLSLSAVAAILGELHPQSVRQLIASGKLTAVEQRIPPRKGRPVGRPRSPRLFVLASELARYMAALPVHEPEGTWREEEQLPLPPGVAEELAGATEYYS